MVSELVFFHTQLTAIELNPPVMQRLLPAEAENSTCIFFSALSSRDDKFILLPHYNKGGG